VLLAWGEQAGSGVEHTASLVEGVCGPTASMVEFLLAAPVTLIESITGEVYDAKGTHDRGCVWELFSGCAFEAGDSIRRYDLDVLAPGVRLGGQPGLEDLFGAARDRIQEPGGAATISYGSQVQDDSDVFVAVGGVAPHVFIHADDAHPLEMIGITCEYALAFA